MAPAQAYCSDIAFGRLQRGAGWAQIAVMGLGAGYARWDFGRFSFTAKDVSGALILELRASDFKPDWLPSLWRIAKLDEHGGYLRVEPSRVGSNPARRDALNWDEATARLPAGERAAFDAIMAAIAAAAERRGLDKLSDPAAAPLIARACAAIRSRSSGRR